MNQINWPAVYAAENQATLLVSLLHSDLTPLNNHTTESIEAIANT